MPNNISTMYDNNSPNLNDISNNLILKYDETFNELYNKLTILNNSIMNKESYINKIYDEIYDKEIKIIILYNVIIIIFFLFLIGGLYKTGILSLIISIIVFILFILFMSFHIYFNVKKLNFQYYFNNKINNMKVVMQDFSEKIDNKTCPSTCTIKPYSKKYSNSNSNSNSNIEKELNFNRSIPFNNAPTLNIDNASNVWKYGDSPQDPMIYVDNEIPSFEGNINGLTYYECKWIGNNYGQLPNKETQYSSIPCSYRPNYKEVNRYNCKANMDPNIDGIAGNCELLN
jgi:hypothetical protein